MMNILLKITEKVKILKLIILKMIMKILNRLIKIVKKNEDIHFISDDNSISGETLDIDLKSRSILHPNLGV